jgi:hypothetical protein
MLPEKSNEYRQMAAECLRRAKRAGNIDDTAFLLELAYRWHMLAQDVVPDRIEPPQKETITKAARQAPPYSN